MTLSLVPVPPDFADHVDELNRLLLILARNFTKTIAHSKSKHISEAFGLRERDWTYFSVTEDCINAHLFVTLHADLCAALDLCRAPRAIIDVKFDFGIKEVIDVYTPRACLQLNLRDQDIEEVVTNATLTDRALRELISENTAISIAERVNNFSEAALGLILNHGNAF